MSKSIDITVNIAVIHVWKANQQGGDFLDIFQEVHFLEEHTIWMYKDPIRPQVLKEINILLDLLIHTLGDVLCIMQGTRAMFMKYLQRNFILIL